MSKKSIENGVNNVIINVDLKSLDFESDVSSDMNHGIETQVLDRLVTGDDDLTEKLEKTCRCCLAENDDLKPIFDPDDCISSMIVLLTSVQLSQNDCLPTNICLECIEQLIKCINFKQQVETADMTLRHYVTEGYFQGMTLQKVDIEELTKKLTESQEFESSDLKKPSSNGDQNYNLSSVKESENCIENENMINETQENDITSSNQEDEEIESNDNDNNVFLENYETELIKQSHDINSPTIVSMKKRKRKQYECTICNKTFINQKLYFHHMKSHICNVCNRSFKTTEILNNHIKCHRQELTASNIDDKFKCNECDMIFTFENDLYIHGSIHVDSKKFICRKCDKEFPNCLKLKRHVRTHFEDKPYKCPQCGRGFPEMSSLTRHFRLHSGEIREKKHVCTDCGKRYYDLHSLSVHRRNHTGEKPYVCEFCDKRFIDSRLLNSHMKTHMVEKLYACDKCNRRFTHQSTLTTHIRTHTGEKPYVCEFCSKTFIQSSNLSLHMRTHSGIKPYKCNFCSSAFASSSTLTSHKRTHTGEKPYSCSECGKTFARFDLKAHMRTHTGEKPFECLICLKRFITGGQLNQHKRIHNREKVFSCDCCNKCWSTEIELKEHLQKHSDDNEKLDTNYLEQQREHTLPNKEEELPSDVEFNETSVLVNDLLAAVVDTNSDHLVEASPTPVLNCENDSNSGSLDMNEIYIIET